MSAEMQTLIACFKTAANMNRNSAESVVESAKELLLQELPGTKLPLTIHPDEVTQLRHVFLEIGGKLGNHPALVQTAVHAAREQADKLMTTAKGTGLLGNVYAKRPIH